MARSTLDTLVYSTILVAPLATALVYIASATAPEPVIVVATPDCPAPAPASTPTTIPAESAIAEPVLAEAVPPATAEPPPAGAGVLMFDRRLVLATAPDSAWATGPLRGHPNEYGVTATKAVDLARLPSFLAALADQRFTVFAADGSSCVVDSGPLSIYARVDGEVRMLAASDEEWGDEGPSPRQLAGLRKQVFADHAQLLVARPEGNPRCTGMWARRADLPAPAVFGVRPLTEEATKLLADEVAPLIADLPAVARLAASYEAWYDDLDGDGREHYAKWSGFFRETISVRRWEEVGGASEYLTVDIGSDGVACSDEFAEHTSFVLVRDGDAWRVLADEGFWRPQALMDLDRDGHLEAVTANGFALVSSGPDHGLAQSFEIPWWGCPC